MIFDPGGRRSVLQNPIAVISQFVENCDQSKPESYGEGESRDLGGGNLRKWVYVKNRALAERPSQKRLHEILV